LLHGKTSAPCDLMIITYFFILKEFLNWKL
jgi:hypothetical protein